ncbi:MAG: FAD-binding dehydrogenase [Frankiales bacterium]|nr:FAD-binding dehydrogenase [Frankiales bacterium]
MPSAVPAPLPVEVDVVVVGSGCAGLTAALTAADGGLDVLVLEKSDVVGGTTAWAGGGIWVPGNSPAAAAGFQDSPEAGARYVRALVGDIVREDVLEAFVHGAREMVDFLHSRTPYVRFALHAGEADYRQDLDGAVLDGRLLSPVPFDGRTMGERLAHLRRPLKEFNAPFGFMVSFDDVPHLLRVRSSLTSARHVAAMVLRYGRDRLRHPRGTRLTMGNALAARLYESALAAGIDVRRSAPVQRLLVEDGRVTGVEVQVGGRTQTVRARRGVVLASGGFSGSLEMRRQFLPYPEHHVSLMPDSNTGDGMRAALDVGGELELGNHANASYAVMSVLHKRDGTLGKYPHVFLDRPKPGYIAVDAQGRRFGNEASGSLVKAMHDTGAVPAHLVCDAVAIKKHGLGLVLPGGLRLKAMVRDGYVLQADTLEELAGKIGVPPAALAETVAANDRYAAEGVDPEFGKGATEVDRALGDPTHRPNPCLGPISTAPFYAVQVFPGGSSTMLGLKTDAAARVLDKDTGRPVPGLYACGLDMNALWRGREPAHGSYIALGMTFGHLAGRDLVAAGPGHPAAAAPGTVPVAGRGSST